VNPLNELYTESPPGNLNFSYRNPKISALLSGIGVGLGQFYNGETGKGLGIIAVFFTAMYVLTAYTALNPVVLLFSIWAYAIFDAYTSAENINNLKKPFHGKSIFFWPGIVLLAGAVIVILVPGLGTITPVSPLSWFHFQSGPEPRIHVNYSREQLETGQVIKEPSYVLRGRNGHIQFTMYQGVNDYLAVNNPTEEFGTNNYYLKLIDDGVQQKYLAGFMNQLKKKSDITDDQARIAISISQQIYYERNQSLVNDQRYNTPYETMFSDTGTCADKSILLAYILKQLGYGVSLLEFPNEHHIAVGVKAPLQYTFKDTGYAFIDPVCNNLIPTYDKGKYGEGENKKSLTSARVIKISDGNSFDSIGEEYQDALEWNRLVQLAGKEGNALERDDLFRYGKIYQKYGMVQVYSKDVCPF
jgi:TM2 domain-containing membrane protein YozV